MEHQEIVHDWCAVIAAAGEADPSLAAAIGASYKASARFCGKPSLSFSMEACRGACLGGVAIVCPQQVRDDHEVSWPNEKFCPPGNSPVASAANGVQAYVDFEKFLFLPADSPLILASDVSLFISSVESRLPGTGAKWYAAGLASKEDVARAYPGADYRFLRFFGERYASGALYAASREGFLHILDIAQKSVANRKSQFRLAAQFGVLNLAWYLSGLMPLARAEQRLTKLLDGSAFIIRDCHPRTTLDFDTVEDWRYLSENFERLRLEQA